MQNWRAGLVLTTVLSITGCATPPQRPISLKIDTTTNAAGRIGIAQTTLPKVDTSFPGAGCLICYAAASAMHSSLTTHVQTLPTEDLAALKSVLADTLRKRGADVVVIEEAITLDTLPAAAQTGPDLATKDFSSFKTQYGIQKLVLIDVTSLGVQRNYNTYIPSGDPKALMRGAGYLINLSSNAYEWYMPLNVLKSADGKWDEPPKFPGLTNAYFQALETGKDQLVRPFTR